MKYLVVVEETSTGYSAYSPDMEGCVAAGKSRDEVEKLMSEAIEFHLEGIREDHQRIPKPHSYSTYLEIAA